MKASQEHAGATLELPTEEMLRKNLYELSLGVSETISSLSETGFLLPYSFCFNRERWNLLFCDSLFCSLFTAKPNSDFINKEIITCIFFYEVLPFLIYDLSMNDMVSLTFMSHIDYIVC